ncbi:sugar phosphate isomerase/epimerase family protein [Aquiflexum gelatinilyticum]|uniref:sugar phosphate isomerase/epimerase family protein n=1 Tax=Aquiflexum gelatinilyticum TaxID=2961943 RepID=UPI00216A7B6B|nr:sugar phosphate isomerase/epimerase [Aquiflexum gelatinilyticum]MCS4434250.1 sugar phosphate isomerase/epimerase [Aquiflexum gelatinilyticum]
MKSSNKFTTSFSPQRRNFLQKTGLAALAMAFPLPSISMNFEGVSMGIVVHSYGARWNSKVPSEKYPGFENALQLIEHCHQIGAGGVQVGVNNWTSDFAKKVRDQREKHGMYLEGSIGLPKSKEELDKFEKEVLAAKEAGATILRTVCLGGRRYENFKTEAEFLDFKAKSILSLQLVEPIVRKHKMKLAVENHKDWRAAELVEIIKGMDSEWIGVTLDFGNNYSLLEKSEDVIGLLAPYSFSTHIKDMGVKSYSKGLLLSEVPLGEGIVDLKKGIELCRKYNPDITFNLEMITRDPLEIPCLEEGYWATFNNISGPELAGILKMVREKSFSGELPYTRNLDPEQRLDYEEANVLASLRYSKSELGLGK